MFSNDNYYNSAVFSTLSLNFGLNASFITIPNKSSLSNVSMTVDDNYDMTNENGVMTTHLKFLYNDNTVGTTTLNISAAGTDTGSLLPYINNDVSSSYKPKHVSELIYGYLLELVPLFFLSSTLLKNGQEEKDREDTITEEDADYNKQRIRS